MFSKKIACGKCKFINPEGSIRCVRCGEKLLPAQINIVWNRSDADFSQRFDLFEPAKHFEKNLIVSNGTNAIMSVGGECKGVLPAGTYSKFGVLLKKCGIVHQEKTISLIFIDTSEVTISFAVPFGDLKTKDHIELGAEGRLTATIDDAEYFYENYLKNKYTLQIEDLNHDFHEPISYALRNFVSNYTESNLRGDTELNSQLENSLISYLNYVFDSKGIKALELNWIKFRTRNAPNQTSNNNYNPSTNERFSRYSS